MADFIPSVLSERRGLMMVELARCPLCDRTMVTQPRGRGLFALYIVDSFEKQVQRAGWVMTSSIQVDANEICRECADAGKATFLCALCGQRYPTDQKHEQFGDPPEFLCKRCYETATAADWGKRRTELLEAHRWDFE